MSDWKNTDWANLKPGKNEYHVNVPKSDEDEYQPPVIQEIEYYEPQVQEPIEQRQEAERVENNYWDTKRFLQLDKQANWIVKDAATGEGYYENPDIIPVDIDHSQIHLTADYLRKKTDYQYDWDDEYWDTHNWRTDDAWYTANSNKWPEPEGWNAQSETDAVQAEQVQTVQNETGTFGNTALPITEVNTPAVGLNTPPSQTLEQGTQEESSTLTTPSNQGQGTSAGSTVTSDAKAGTYKTDGGNIYYGSTDELYDEMRNNLLATDLSDTHKQMFVVDKTGADYNNLDLYGKVSYSLASRQAGSVKNAPELSKWTQGIKSSLLSAGGAGELVENATLLLSGGNKKIAEIANKAVSIPLAAFIYAASKGGVEMPEWLGKGLELLDMPNTLMTQFYGKSRLALEAARPEGATKGRGLTNLITAITNPLDMIKSYKNLGSTYGVDDDIMNMISKYATSTMVAIGDGDMSRYDQNITSALLGSDYTLQKGEVTRANLGLDGVYKLAEGTYGEEGLVGWAQSAQKLKDMGYSPEQIEAFISQSMYEYYGDYSELHVTNEDETLDPTNYTNGLTARSLQGIGKVTGDVNLQNAAKTHTGDWYSDFGHNFLPSNMQRVVQQVVNTASGGTAHESGGINDIKDTYDMTNVYGSLDNVTPFGKRFSGINEDGTLKNGFTPNKNSTVSERMKSFFSETNESKLYSEADVTVNIINTALEDAVRARGDEDPITTAQRFEAIVDELVNPDNIGENSPLAGIKNSAIFQTIKADIASGVGKYADTLRGYVAEFQNTSSNRTMLNNVAEALGMSAAEVITQFKEKPDVIKKQIVDTVTKNGGVLGKITIADVTTAQEFADRVQQTLQPFTGENSTAWDARLLGVQMSTKMFDGIQETLMQKYDVQSKNFLYRFSDTIKSIQSVLLLGLSPTYIMNNLTNNIATRYTLGYGGFLTQKVINDWYSRWGFKSARADVAEGEYGTFSYGSKWRENLHKSVKEKTSVKDWMNSVRNAATWTNEHVGVFSKLSGIIENKEAEQIMTMASRTYMNRTWKEGVNYRKMDPVLEQMLGKDMTRAVYHAINSGVNMNEIETAIFGTYVQPSVKEAVVEAVRQTGIQDPEGFVNEVFVKTGVLDTLRNKITGLHGEAEIKAAVDAVKDYARNYAEYKYRSDMATKAESVENVVTSEGVSAVVDNMVRMQEENYRLGESWKERMRLLYSLKNSMDNTTWSAEYTRAREENDLRFKQLYDMNTQVLLGTINGLGITDDGKKKYKSILVDAMTQKQTAYLNMYEQQITAFETYRAKVDKANERKRKNKINKVTWEAEVKSAWNAYNEKMDTINQYVVTIENAQNERFNNALSEGLKTVTSKKLHELIDNLVVSPLNKADEICKQIQTTEAELRVESRKVDDYNERNKIYNEQYAQLKQLRAEENQLRMSAYKAIKEITQSSPVMTSEASTANYTQEDYDIAARIEIARREAEQVQKENAEYVAQVESAIGADGENIFNDNDMFSDAVSVRVQKETLKEIAKRAGANSKEAKEYVRFMMAMKKTYEAEHPGKDFFDELGLTIYFHTEKKDAQTGSDGETVKGRYTYSPLSNGNIAEIFVNGDISTLIHETMHAVNTILDDKQKDDFAAWNNISREHYDELESKYRSNPTGMTEAEAKEWKNIQEKFAYGFEEYLRYDKAPTAGIRAVFKTVKTFFINLYENVKGYIYNVNPEEEINGVRLADIFESLVTRRKNDEDKQRQEREAPQPSLFDQTEAVTESPSVIQVSTESPSVARVSSEQSVTEAANAEQAQVEKPSERTPDANGAIYGNNAPMARGHKNVENEYEFVYKVVDLDKLVPSHIVKGTTITVNPDYSYSQPREDRNTMPSVQDSISKAYNMVPDLLVDEFRQIGAGTPIVTKDNNVADGNGRAIMLKFARDNNLPTWRKYQEYLRSVANDYGFDAEEIDSFKNPVLVRELRSEVDPNVFAQDANTATAMRYSAYETAMQDAKELDIKTLYGGDDLNIEANTPDFLNRTKSKSVNNLVQNFLNNNPGDRASLITAGGKLNDDGIDRLTKALFASVYGENAKDLVRISSMMGDTNGIKRIADGFAETLPAVGAVKAKVLSGGLDAEYDISNALGTSARVVNEARNSHTSIEMRINQNGFDGMLPNDIRAMAYFFANQSTSKSLIKDFVREYAVRTLTSQDNAQTDLFGGALKVTPEQILEGAFNSFADKQLTDKQRATVNESISILHEDVQSGSLFQNDISNRTVNPRDINPEAVQPFQHDYSKVLNIAEKIYQEAEKEGGSATIISLPLLVMFVQGEDIGNLDGAMRKFANKAGVMNEIMRYWAQARGEENFVKDGYSVKPCAVYEYGGQTVKGKVYRDGQLVALIPEAMTITEVNIADDIKCKVIGIDPQNPEVLIILSPTDDLIKIDPTEGIVNKLKTDTFRPEMDFGSMPVPQPEGESNAEINFEMVEPVLERLSKIYAESMDKAMTENKFSNLPPEGQRLLREYVDYVVRQDLASTKFKATKFSEMMRDAALLNYDKKYGFDNFLTFLSPYQFWQTRSAANWIRRLNDRRHLYNRYFRLKELADKREKDFLPSRVEGMYGLPIYGLPDYLGNRVFFNTQQEVPIAGFLDPILETVKESSVLEASAKKILGDWVEDGTITSEQYTAALNDRNNANWKEAMAQAEIENPRRHDTVNLLQEYLGLSLPASWIKAGLEDDPSALTQLPVTKLGNALGATFGDNFAGDSVQFVASLPERGMYALMNGAFGDKFKYKDFGSYGDYYIDQQLFYMVMEGKISVDQMMLAMEQRDGNKIYTEAYNRAREQIAMKTPGYGVIATAKNLGSDIKKYQNGDESITGKDLANDFLGLLEEFVLSPKGQYVVTEGESTMRELMAEQTEAYKKGTQNEFFREHPEMSYKNLQYATDDPEGRYRTWCYKTITSIYYSMSDAEKQNVRETFGLDFDKAILDKETRSYETVDINKLTGWAQALNGTSPYLQESVYGQNAEQMNYTPLNTTTVNQVENFYRQKEEKFPGISIIENYYYTLPIEERSKYVANFPQWQNYIAWKDQYKQANPEYATWASRRSDYYAMKEVDEAYGLMDNLTLNAFKRGDVTEEYYPSVRRIQQEIGNTDSTEYFVKKLLEYSLW